VYHDAAGRADEFVLVAPTPEENEATRLRVSIWEASDRASVVEFRDLAAQPGLDRQVYDVGLVS